MPTPAVTTNPFPLQAFLDWMTREEDDKLLPYKDSLGYWTVGVGHFIGGDAALDHWRALHPPSGTLTPILSRVILGQDVQETLAKLDAHLPWWRRLSPTRQMVLAAMCFQMGWGTLNTFGGTLSAIQDGYWNLASRHMLASKWADQTPARAKRCAWMMANDNMKFPKGLV